MKTLEESLNAAREGLAQAERELAAATRRSVAAREMGGGLLSFGGSGPQRAAQQVRAASTSAGRAWLDANDRVEHWTRRIRGYENAIKERDRVRFDREDVVGARGIRTELGWHKVARVNKTTVSVETGYSWTDRIAFDKILEVHR